MPSRTIPNWIPVLEEYKPRVTYKPLPGTTDHIRHPPDTASLPVIITIDPSQKLTFPTTGILFQISISTINLNVRIISEASLVKKVPELESTLKKTL